MLAEGVPPAMIESAGRQAGMPVGPLSLNDEVALDLILKITQATEAQVGEAVDPAQREILTRMVEGEGGSAARTARASTITPRVRRSACGRASPISSRRGSTRSRSISRS